MIGTPSQKPTDHTQMLAALADSSIVKSALAEYDAKVILEREGLLAKLRKLERDAEANYPRLVKETDAAVAQVKLAEAALLDARQKLNFVMSKRSGANAAHEAETTRLEMELRDGADPAIDQFISDMIDEFYQTHKSFSFQNETIVNQVTGRKVRSTFNNGKSVEARVKAIKLAMESADALRLEPDQRGITEKLAKLRAQLPSVGAVEDGR